MALLDIRTVFSKMVNRFLVLNNDFNDSKINYSINYLFLQECLRYNLFFIAVQT